MGINICQYRAAIGNIKSYVNARSEQHYSRFMAPLFIYTQCVSKDHETHSHSIPHSSFYIFIYIFIMSYLIPIILSLNLKTVDQPHSNYVTTNLYHPLVQPHITGSFKLTLCNAYFVVIINYLWTKMIVSKSFYNMKNLCYDSQSKMFSKGKFLSLIISIWIVSMNIILVTLSNMSMLNPGPQNSTHGIIQNLNIYYQNVQGLISYNSLGQDHPTLNLTKLSEFQATVYDTKPDVIILNETWLKPSIKNSELLSTNMYKIFRVDRSPDTHPVDCNNPKKYKKNGGGVLIAVNCSLDLNPRIIKITSKAEVLSIELKIPNKKKVCLSTCYRVGTLGDLNHSELNNHFREIARNNKIRAHFILGDFNLDTVNWDNHTSINRIQTKFLDTFNNLGLSQQIFQPTHIKGNILDILLTDKPDLLSDVRILGRDEILKSDHFAILCSINVRFKRLKCKKRKIYNFKKADWDSLNNELRRVNWNSHIQCCDPTTAWIKFKSILLDLCNKYIPKVTIRSNSAPPWFDSDVHKLCMKKEKHRKLYKQTNNSTHHNKFKSCRKELKKLIKEKMRSNFDDELNQNVITKKFWSYVKSSTNSSRLPDCMSLNGKFRNNSKDIADLFNGHFFEQFSKKSNYDIDIDFSNDPFINFKICHHVVRKLLTSLNQNKSHGPDGINGKILKNCAVSIAYPLSLLFNLSFNTGHIPSEWKLANIVPVHKKGDKSAIENYRPISLTCLIMKIFEKCIRNELMNLCQEKIHHSQHGFLPGKSCTTQLLPFVSDITLNLNNNDPTDIIYFDFAKAFDSVNHDIILSKLKHEFKIDGLMLKFIREYLQNRKQRVVVGDTMSDDLDVVSGVPQGSIIGPLLFVLFINDLHKCVSPGTNLALYADDTKIWRLIKSEQDCTALQNDIDALSHWSKINCMIFHPQKCKVLSVTHQIIRNILPFTRFVYTMDGVVLDYCGKENDLGITMHDGLNWNPHCIELIAKATSKFNLLRRTCHFINSIIKKRTLYITLVRSIFEHGSIIWAPSSQITISKFEALQKRCIKWILKEQFTSYEYSEYLEKLKELDILPIKYKFMYTDIVLFHKIVHNLIPISLPKYIVTKSTTRASKSDPLSFKISNDIKHQKRIFQSSFFARCITPWNRLPFELKNLSSTVIFSRGLKQHIWDYVLDLPDFENFNQIEPD